MNPKNLLKTGLLLFALASVLIFTIKEVRGRNAVSSSTAADEETLATTNGPVVVVYYLSEGKECIVCNNLEAYTLETLETFFKPEMDTGRVVYRMRDMDEPQHAHYVTDFQLYTKSVVLAEVREGKVQRWKNLEAVWDHVYDKDDFMKYIQEELRAFLEQPQ